MPAWAEHLLYALHVTFVLQEGGTRSLLGTKGTEAQRSEGTCPTSQRSMTGSWPAPEPGVLAAVLSVPTRPGG